MHAHLLKACTGAFRNCDIAEFNLQGLQSAYIKTDHAAALQCSEKLLREPAHRGLFLPGLTIYRLLSMSAPTAPVTHDADGQASPVADGDAHRKLLGDIAPVANDLSTFTFGFAEAIFKRHFGELTATLVGKVKDAPNIEDLRLPWFVGTTRILTGTAGALAPTSEEPSARTRAG